MRASPSIAVPGAAPFRAKQHSRCDRSVAWEGAARLGVEPSAALRRLNRTANDAPRAVRNHDAGGRAYERSGVSRPPGKSVPGDTRRHQERGIGRPATDGAGGLPQRCDADVPLRTSVIRLTGTANSMDQPSKLDNTHCTIFVVEVAARVPNGGLRRPVNSLSPGRRLALRYRK